jgi:hypothetical protein
MPVPHGVISTSTGPAESTELEEVVLPEAEDGVLKEEE